MPKYLVHHIVGSFLIGENGDLIDKEFSIKDIDENVNEQILFEEGTAPLSLRRLMERMGKEDEIVVETQNLSRILSKNGFKKVSVSNSDVLKNFRKSLIEVTIKEGYFGSEDEFHQYIHDFTLEHTRRKLREAAQKRDLLAAQAIRAIDDLDKTYNLFVIRLREWFSVHFPELDELVPNHEQYVKLVKELGHRDNFNVENIKKVGISEQKAEIIAKSAKESIGADLSEFDIRPIQTMARMAWEMYELRRGLSSYIDAVMKEVAPNVTSLVGSLLGARLISLAGSLANLAKLPASTIQVLGAEKALFRALRTGGRPPKHGIIFQYPEVHKSPRWQRGKIARALAAKLAIAAKVDAFTGRFIGDKLVEELRKRIEEIKKIYAKPPARKPQEARPPAFKRKGKKRKKGKRKR